MNRYKIEGSDVDIYYNKEDEGYIAISQSPKCYAFGRTEQEVKKEIKISIKIKKEDLKYGTKRKTKKNK